MIISEKYVKRFLLRGERVERTVALLEPGSAASMVPLGGTTLQAQAGPPSREPPASPEQAMKTNAMAKGCSEKKPTVH